MIGAIAIDCCWLVTCGDEVREFSSHIRLLEALDRRSISLLMDFEQRIVNEYERHVTDGMGRAFVKSCVLNGRVEYFSSKLTGAQESALDAIAFDPADRPYLGVASRHGGAPYMTTEEKHLKEQQAQGIKAATGVDVFDTEAALRAVG